MATAPPVAPPSFQAHTTRFDASELSTNHCLRAATAPPLTDLCLRLLAASFSQAPRPSLRGIPPRLVDKFVELLPPDLPLDVSAHLIANESYWRRAAKAIWPICDVFDHGSSWKRLFFEKTVAEFLESFDPAKTEMAELARILSLAKDYIFSLRLRHFPANVDIELLFQKVPALANLEMTYGVKNVGLEYRRELFGMPPADAVSLSRALRVTETLTILALPCNVLDDATTRLLADGLHDNSTVTSLDLSHNRISDRGVKAIAKALGDGSVVSHLNLSDNLIHAGGGRHLGRALSTNTSLEVLNLRLNRLCDDGGIRLVEGLLKNQTLANLNLASNAVGLGTARALCAVLEQCASLRALDLGGNELSDEAGVLLLEALGRNESLAQIDLRANHVLADTAASIDELCTANAEKARVEAMCGALDVYH